MAEKIDLGEGYRRVAIGETIQEGDQFWCPAFAGWINTGDAGRSVASVNLTYRRKADSPVGSWFRCNASEFITKCIGVSSLGDVMLEFSDGSWWIRTKSQFAKIFVPLPDCTGFDWVEPPAIKYPRYWINPRWQFTAYTKQESAESPIVGYTTDGVPVPVEILELSIESDWNAVDEATALARVKRPDPVAVAADEEPIDEEPQDQVFLVTTMDRAKWNALEGGDEIPEEYTMGKCAELRLVGLVPNGRLFLLEGDPDDNFDDDDDWDDDWDDESEQQYVELSPETHVLRNGIDEVYFPQAGRWDLCLCMGGKRLRDFPIATYTRVRCKAEDAPESEWPKWYKGVGNDVMRWDSAESRPVWASHNDIKSSLPTPMNYGFGMLTPISQQEAEKLLKKTAHT